MARVLDIQRSSIPLPPLSVGWNPVPVATLKLKVARWVRFIFAAAAGNPVRFLVESVQSRSGRVSFTYPLDVFSIGEPPSSPSTEIDLFGSDFRIYVQRSTNTLNNWGPGSAPNVDIWAVAEEIDIPSRNYVCHTLASQVLPAGDIPLPAPIAGADPYSTSVLFPLSDMVSVDWYPPGGPAAAGTVKLYARPEVLGGALAPVRLAPIAPVAFDNTETAHFTFAVPPGTYLAQSVSLYLATSGIAPNMLGGAFYFREYYRTA